MYNYYKLPLRLCTLLALHLFFINSSCNSSNSSKEDEKVNKDDKAGFVQLFDGKTLNGWEGDTAYWKIKDGIIVGEATSPTALKNNTFLIWTGGEPGDFELITEYRISPEGNSGINYRSEKVKDVPFALKGYQADIDGANNYTGQNYEERGRTTLAYRGQKVSIPTTELGQSKNNAWSAALVEASLGNTDSLKSKINDGWNECHLIVKGDHLQHYINGFLMSDVMDNDTTNRKLTGLLGLQIHAGHVMKVEYRNIRLKKE
jgi:hypothetical protein